MKITTTISSTLAVTSEVEVDFSPIRDALGLVMTLTSPLNGVCIAKVEVQADELERIGRALAPWVRT